jgi:hypothetical protein
VKEGIGFEFDVRLDLVRLQSFIVLHSVCYSSHETCGKKSPQAAGSDSPAIGWLDEDGMIVTHALHTMSRLLPDESLASSIWLAVCLSVPLRRSHPFERAPVVLSICR